jgi:hypothetical protein
MSNHFYCFTAYFCCDIPGRSGGVIRALSCPLGIAMAPFYWRKTFVNKYVVFKSKIQASWVVMIRGAY